MKVDPEKFWKLTLQDYWLLMLSLIKDLDLKKAEIQNRTWMHADLKAHISNFSMYKKAGGTPWTADDFMRKEGDEKKEKLTMKKARQALGSTFSVMHKN